MGEDVKGLRVEAEAIAVENGVQGQVSRKLETVGKLSSSLQNFEGTDPAIFCLWRRRGQAVVRGFDIDKVTWLELRCGVVAQVVVVLLASLGGDDAPLSEGQGELPETEMFLEARGRRGCSGCREEAGRPRLPTVQ